jgi:hypothetical protein
MFIKVPQADMLILGGEDKMEPSLQALQARLFAARKFLAFFRTKAIG